MAFRPDPRGSSYTLAELGWDADHAGALARLELPECRPARIVSLHRGWASVMDGTHELLARVRGRLFGPSGDEVYPAVGDWIALRPETRSQPPMVEAMLPRRTRLSRRLPGRRTAEQVIAANVDTTIVVMALAEDFNLARLERYMIVLRASGSSPVVVLNKADLCDDPDEWREETARVTGDAPVFAMSAIDGEGVAQLAPFLSPGRTIALVGSSGAGKSTLANALAGREIMATGEIREQDGKGRHTTSHRQLLRLPSGALLIDNPGLREVGAWVARASDVADAFEDILAIAAKCRFRDCGHGDEPGCAVREAIEQGDLDLTRLENFQRLTSEVGQLNVARREAARRGSRVERARRGRRDERR